jgi:hypothetical protein
VKFRVIGFYSKETNIESAIFTIARLSQPDEFG